MTMRSVARTVLVAAFAVAGPAFAADEGDIKLHEGAARPLVEANCSVCHSLDYIPMNSPFLDRPKWEATVKKMTGPFGAPIEEKDVVPIIEYLVANYGVK
jgi:hypothetical protein